MMTQIGLAGSFTILQNVTKYAVARGEHRSRRFDPSAGALGTRYDIPLAALETR